jgi:hypothetical protein
MTGSLAARICFPNQRSYLLHSSFEQFNMSVCADTYEWSYFTRGNERFIEKFKAKLNGEI